RALLARKIGPHIRNHRQRERPCPTCAWLDAARHVSDRALWTERESVASVQKVGPVANGPVVTHRGNHGYATRFGSSDRRGYRHHVLRVHEIVRSLPHSLREIRRESGGEPLALVVVARERQRRCLERERRHVESVIRRGVDGLQDARWLWARPGDVDEVVTGPEASCELVRASAPSAADGRHA